MSGLSAFIDGFGRALLGNTIAYDAIITVPRKINMKQRTACRKITGKKLFLPLATEKGDIC